MTPLREARRVVVGIELGLGVATGLGEALADCLDRRMRGWSARSGG